MEKKPNPASCKSKDIESPVVQLELPEYLRSRLSFNAIAMWNPSLPLTVNFNRLISAGLLGQGAGPEVRLSNNPDTSKAIECLSDSLNEFSKECLEDQPDFAHPSITTFVLHWIKRYIYLLFREGPEIASKMYLRLETAIRCQTTTIEKLAIHGLELDGLKFSVPWEAPKLTVALVLVLAVPADQALKTLSVYTRSLGAGPIPLDIIQNTPSQSLKAAMNKAQFKACGELETDPINSFYLSEPYPPPLTTTILGVQLVDVGYQKACLYNREFAETLMSFSHSFVIGAEPRGFVVWQGEAREATAC